MSAIEIHGLVKRFGSVTALAGFDLSVPRGAVFGFLGPNGAGKTTTLRIMTGLARATAGHVVIEGVTVGRGARPPLGYLPDTPSFYPWMTAREFLRYCGPARPGRSAHRRHAGAGRPARRGPEADRRLRAA